MLELQQTLPRMQKCGESIWEKASGFNRIL
jgi:hypothetical protein